MIALAPAPAAEQLGKFELLEQIGHGGMATVHRAMLRGMGGFERQVVIKRILPELASDEHFVKMFIAEAKLSAQLEHPNIVQIYDFGVVDRTYYLAMEYLEGVTLLNYIKKHGRRQPMPPAAAAFVIHQVCLGLDYAHCLSRDGTPLQLVHRDVSPANVMLTTHGGVKVLDFGIAKAVEAIEREDTRTGTLKGKWSYMSPEQVEGKEVTARSDIFATGIMLWEMLTCRRLFKAKTDYLTLSNVVRAKVPPVTSFRPEVPAVFDRVCAKALARLPEDRYQTAEEMSDALEEILSISHFTATQLADTVRPMLTEERPSGEPSASNSTSLSESAVGFVAADESVSSLAKGEAASFSPVERPRPGWMLPALIGGGLVALVLVVTTLVVALSGDGEEQPVPAPKPVTRPPAKRCEVALTSTPSGALVAISGEHETRGTTPLTVRLSCTKERVELVLNKTGFATERVFVEPASGKQKLALELSPQGKPDLSVQKTDAGAPDGSAPDARRAADARAVDTKAAAKRPTGKVVVPSKPERLVVPKRGTKGKGRLPRKGTRKGTTKPKKKVPDLKGGGLADPYGS